MGIRFEDPQLFSREDTELSEPYCRLTKKIEKNGGREFLGFEERSQCLALNGGLKPDMGSLTLSSLNFKKQASINTLEMIKALARKMVDNGIKPELEAFDLRIINYANYLIHKGVIKPLYYFNQILGNIACV